MSDAKTLAKDHGLTLADVAELIAPPKPQRWADLDDRADEVRAALDLSTAKTGEAVDQLWLHLTIQNSPELRGQLYNIVMSLRHS